jgi:hypothetical protein
MISVSVISTGACGVNKSQYISVIFRDFSYRRNDKTECFRLTFHAELFEFTQSRQDAKCNTLNIAKQWLCGLTRIASGMSLGGFAPS